MKERLKAARMWLGLSQKYVAEKMGLSRSAISAIESGQRKVSAEELDHFAQLYGLSVDELLHGRVEEQSDIEIFGRVFSMLPEDDKKEIMNLIEFKRKYSVANLE